MAIIIATSFREAGILNKHSSIYITHLAGVCSSPASQWAVCLAMQSQPCTLSIKNLPAILYALLQTWHQCSTQESRVSMLLFKFWWPSTLAWARPLFSWCWLFQFRNSPLLEGLSSKHTESYLLFLWLCPHFKKKKTKKKLTLSSGKMGSPVSLLVIYLSIWYSVWGIIDSIEIFKWIHELPVRIFVNITGLDKPEGT